jgi:Zn-dependent metalloprotease
VFCILPPHILQNIDRNGDEKQRDVVRRTLVEDRIYRNGRMLAAERWRGLRAMFRSQRRAMGRVPWGAAAVACQGEVDRSIYTANNAERLPGKLVRGEGEDPTGDAATDEAYEGLGRTYELYCQEYDRDSLDGAGMPLSATVHYGKDYDNAFWNGTQMVFGDGDGEIFNRFTISIDVIGHELTHGVTEHESGLIYLAQPGALNEHLSDVFGSLVKQYPNETADKADWLIGAGLLTKTVKGVALRSMKAPGTAYDDPLLGKDPQPAHMSDYVRGFDDNFGVHINSGIPNHAFYLAATKIGGFAWEKAGLIWYEAMTSPMLRPRARFLNFASLTVSVAGGIFGPNSDEQTAVWEAWSEVGLEV